ncbi:Pentatricopeptide repeat-containing protein At3g22690 [Linum perenne]
MKEQGVQKDPGSSSIQIDGEVYEFTSGTDSRPEMNQIESILTDAGFVSDLTNVLLDVDEAEKQYLLSRHSEKLAMAFSLINTTTTMPIRVMKNLRICSDCHSFAKLVSRVYDREVIIRDNNRFHFFRQGSCSCGDYW